MEIKWKPLSFLLMFVIVLLTVGLMKEAQAWRWQFNSGNILAYKVHLLEAENKELHTIMDRIAEVSIGVRHTMAGCYGYQSEISFLLADYYKYVENQKQLGEAPTKE